MWKAFGMCAVIALTAACGLSEMYEGPTGGIGGGIGGNGVTGGQSVGTADGTGTGNGTVGGNGVNGNVGTTGTTTNGPPGSSSGGRNNGNGPGATGSAAGSGTGRNGGAVAGASSSGTAGKGSTSGGSGGGMCSNELQPCAQGDGGTQCCAGQKPALTCTTEPSAGGAFCETEGCPKNPCTNAQTVCEDGTCGLNICGGKSGNGKYNSTCTSGSSDGTCVPKGMGMDEYGICFAGGASDGGCSDSATTTDQKDLCVAGQACLPNPDGPGDLCRTICDPGFGGGGKTVCAAAGYSGGCFAIGSLGVCFNF